MKRDNARLADDVMLLFPFAPPPPTPGTKGLDVPGVAGEDKLSVEVWEVAAEPASAAEVSLLRLAVSKILLPLK